MTLMVQMAAIAAVVFAMLAVAGRHPVHSATALIAMLLALALVFFGLGAPFAAVLEVLIYAGAIMVLFVFVVMVLNLGSQAMRREQEWMGGGIWVVPGLVNLALLGVGAYAILKAGGSFPPQAVVGAKEVGLSLYRSYVIAVELASLLLIAALVAAFHLAPPTRTHGRTQAKEATAGEKVSHV